MGAPSNGGASPAEPAQDRLDSWKEIAAYLNRDVTTVQRWEKREGMPVHRHVHDRMGSVHASRSELDAWIDRRNRPPEQEDSNADSSPLSTAATPVTKRKPTFIWLLAAVAAALTAGVLLWIRETDRFWRSPIANARIERVTDFGGVEQAAAVSRDGHFVAFLSDRDGHTDVWLTQVGSGQFHNLTQGKVQELANPQVRTLGFSPDSSVVTFWIRRKDAAGGNAISTWAVPLLGGEPRPYMEGVAELSWSPDGSRLAFHTPAAGDPLFVSKGPADKVGSPIFTAQEGLHAHFPVWSPDSKFIYFVQGSVPDNMDIWRVPSLGGAAERITFHNGNVSYPAFVDGNTLMYLAVDADGSGPWLYSFDVRRRIPHRLESGVDRYTSMAASADGRRLVAALAAPERTLWRASLSGNELPQSAAAPVSVTTSTSFSPRLGPGYLLYVSQTGTRESIWKLTNGSSTELWNGDEGEQVIGGPSIANNKGEEGLIAFSVREQAKSRLYVMHADGTGARIVTDSLDLRGAPAWAPDGNSILTAAEDHGMIHLFRIGLEDSRPTPFVQEYSTDPVWSPDGGFVVFSGMDTGTTFSLKGVTADGDPRPLPALLQTRGARRVVFLPGGQTILTLRGEIQHKDLWLVDLSTGAEKQLSHFGPDFEITDFDLSPDGRSLVLERVRDRSDIVLLDLPGK